MQKNKLWLLLTVVIIAIAALIYWLMPSTPHEDFTDSNEHNEFSLNVAASSDALAQNSAGFPFSASQKDTEVNCQIAIDNSNRLIVNEATRNCFEYFITQFGEKNIEQIRKDFKNYISQSHKEPALSQVLDLWQRYLDYREHLGEIAKPELDSEDPQYYRSIFNSTQNLRKKFFSDYEIEGLFGTENIYHEYTLNRMVVVNDKKLTESEKAQKLKELFDQLPEDWKENLEQLNKLEDLRKLTADIKARGGDRKSVV